MSKQQVTLFSLIQRWSLIADRDHLTNMISEMKTMFSEIENANIKLEDIIKYKDKILSIWVDLSWSEAKKHHPTWKEKTWWNNQKTIMIRVFGDVYKDIAKNKKPKDIKEVDDGNSFNNVEDMITWVENHKKRVSNGNE